MRSGRIWAAAALLSSAALSCLADDSPPAAVLSSTPPAKYWLRMYPLQPYAEFWRMDLQVPDLKKGLPKVLDALAKNGGTPVMPVANEAASPSQKMQQLSYRLSRPMSARALKALQDLGSVQTLTKSPGAYAGVREEAREKLKKLNAEAESNRDALARMPNTAALVGELIEHLSLVDQTSSDAEGRILLNLELRQAPAR